MKSVGYGIAEITTFVHMIIINPTVTFFCLSTLPYMPKISSHLCLQSSTS